MAFLGWVSSQEIQDLLDFTRLYQQYRKALAGFPTSQDEADKDTDYMFALLKAREAYAVDDLTSCA